MKKILIIPIVSLSLLLGSTAMAEDSMIGNHDMLQLKQSPPAKTSTPATAGEKLQNMSPEQLKAKKQQMQDRWRNMSPAEKQQAREKMLQRWQNMSPEQKQQLQQRMQQRWQNLSPDQKNLIKEKIKMQLDSMSPQERQSLLSN